MYYIINTRGGTHYVTQKATTHQAVQVGCHQLSQGTSRLNSNRGSRLVISLLSMLMISLFAGERFTTIWISVSLQPETSIYTVVYATKSVVPTANQTVDTLIRFIETSGLTRILNSIWSTTLMLL